MREEIKLLSSSAYLQETVQKEGLSYRSHTYTHTCACTDMHASTSKWMSKWVKYATDRMRFLPANCSQQYIETGHRSGQERWLFLAVHRTLTLVKGPTPNHVKTLNFSQNIHFCLALQPARPQSKFSRKALFYKGFWRPWSHTHLPKRPKF